MSVTNWEFSGEEELRSMREQGDEIVRPLMIEVDDPTDSLFAIKRDIPELQKWQPHPTEQGFFVDEFDATRTTTVQQRDGVDHFYWAGSVRWINKLDRKPTDLPAGLIAIRSEALQSATNKDSKGKAILNAAGDPVQPIPIVERVRVFVFQKYTTGLPEELLDLEDVINEDTVNIKGKPRDPKTLLIRKVEIGDEQSTEKEDEKFRAVVLEIAYRKSGWTHRFPNLGFSAWVRRPARVLDDPKIVVNENGNNWVYEKRAITTEDGQRVSK